jgi:hypothetical protein
MAVFDLAEMSSVLGIFFHISQTVIATLSLDVIDVKPSVNADGTGIWPWLLSTEVILGRWLA